MSNIACVNQRYLCEIDNLQTKAKCLEQQVRSLMMRLIFCFVLFFSRPRSDGWPHHGRTFSIYLCLLSFWLTIWLFHGESCPRIDVVHPGRVWSSCMMCFDWLIDWSIDWPSGALCRVCDFGAVMQVSDFTYSLTYLLCWCRYVNYGRRSSRRTRACSRNDGPPSDRSSSTSKNSTSYNPICPQVTGAKKSNC